MEQPGDQGKSRECGDVGKSRVGNGKLWRLSMSRQGPESAAVSLGSSPPTRGAQRPPG